MNGRNVAQLVTDYCAFPADFSEDDIAKFSLEVASSAGRILPKAEDVSELVSGITAGKTSVTVKFGSHKVKATKGHKITYDFRLSVYLAAVNSCATETLTGYLFPVDLTGAVTFWNSWERAKVVQNEPAPEPAPAT